MDERRDLENIWRERLNAAENTYHLARAEAEAVLQSCGCNATSAQIEALHQTQVREAAALEEYMRGLHIFHELVVAGERPKS